MTNTLELLSIAGPMSWMRFSSSKRWVAALLAALTAMLGLAAHDIARDRWWAVTAAQIADARASGQEGIVVGGRLVTEPVAADDAGWLPLRWLLGGLAAGAAILAIPGRRGRTQRTG